VLNTLIPAAEAASGAQRWDEAVELWARVCDQDSENAAAQFKLGVALTHLRRWVEAERHVLRAQALAPGIKPLRQLLHLQFRAQWFDKVEPTVDQLLKLTPTSGDLYIILAKIRGGRGDLAGAIAALDHGRRAAPDDLDVALAYIEAAHRAAEPVARQELERLYGRVAAEPAKAKRVLRVMTNRQVQVARQAKGLPVETALSWEDICQWDDPQGLRRLADQLRRELAQPMALHSSLGDLAQCAIAGMDWEGAEALLRQARAHVMGYISDIVTFDLAFYADLERLGDATLAEGLAEVVTVRPVPSTGATETVFLASDPVYFERFTLPLLRSFRRHNPTIHLHAHLLDGDASVWERLTAMAVDAAGPMLSVSAEAANAWGSKLYYANIRFVRAYQHMKVHQRPLWMMDVDTVVNRDPAPAFSNLAPFDLALWGCPGCLEPWTKVQASVVGLAPTPAGLTFARLVAAFIVFWRKRGMIRWYTDQLALFCVYAYLHRQRRKPRTFFIDATLLSISNNPTSAIHINRGIQKYLTTDQDPATAASEPD
jgi:tetratricopeptide (TPR) repeat protein